MFIILAISGFSYEAAYGELSSWIKRLVWLDQPSKYSALFYYNFWRDFLGHKTAKVFSPLFIILFLIKKIHQVLYSLFSCPYCQSVYYMFIINRYYIEMPILESIILSPIAIIPIGVLDRLRV